ncbi:MAG: transcription termination/antitermination protein NusA [Myxococcales bacterium]|nr:transcription termination/antitermination protein NusA [Myxococcales bacterium]MCB9709447.1 transcription termination/antitermination protein NusA [Myxococcales bacterium]
MRKGELLQQQSSISLDGIIEQVSRDKGIDAKILVETMEQAILTAAKRMFGANRELEAKFNKDTGAVDLFQYMTIVDTVENPERQISTEDAKKAGFEAEVGEELGFQVFYLEDDAGKAKQQDKDFGDLLQFKQHRQGFGRIAAQTAKQVIIQRVRDAERDIIYNEFKERKGEILTGIVRRFERGQNIIVDLGNTEALLPKREQTPRETYRPGDRIVAFLKNIDREARGPQLILSRTDVGLLVKLFEMEVPEIYEGIVRIVAAAREPGARSKIAVSSRDSDVDPVGACVGMKGSRVQAVVQELRGEKIDIVPWDRDPARFVCNAIAPADVARVIIDEGGHAMELVVPDDKLSLAIGRRGQNVRLASQLTGWKLDIISEEKFRRMEEESMTALSLIEGVDEELPRAMYRHGFRSLDEIVGAKDDELSSITGISGDAPLADFRRRASEAMETYRHRGLKKAAADGQPIDEVGRFLLVRGVTQAMAESLLRGGYRSVEDVEREADPDRLAIKTGLDNKRAHAVKSAVAQFLKSEWPEIQEAQRTVQEAQAQAQAEEETSKRAQAEGVASAIAEHAPMQEDSMSLEPTSKET